MPAVARINVTEPYAVREWSKRFGCSTEQLRAAVTAVGNVAADVESTLSPWEMLTVTVRRFEKRSKA